MHACISGAGWLPAIIRKLFQGPCDMVRREAGCARAPGPEPPARAPEPASGQARLPRAARRSESTSDSRTDVRASERLQKWVDGPYWAEYYSYYSYYEYTSAGVY